MNVHCTTRTSAVRSGCRRSRGQFSIFLLLLLLLAPALAAAADAAAKSPAFGFDQVMQQARALAAKPYQPPARLADALNNMTYDTWRDIRFRPEQSIWRAEKLPFELQLFHPGLYYDRTVKLMVVDGDSQAEIEGKRSMFDYGSNAFAPQIPENVGVAGFRVHSAVKTPKYFDEFLVFLGASYLRGIGRDQGYGLSARGVAIDTATTNGEEFPWFRQFWLVKPKKGDTSLQIYALLDGPRISGAYAFRAKPGKETVIDVQSAVFLRAPVAKLGIAPLTSMYFFGENTSPRRFDDFRPEVHDSDGLQILFGNGEWLWRPLQNPPTLQVSSFESQGLSGFGLMQRDRNYGSYEDLEARYELRPSAWIEPQGDWGAGRVELIQIPSDDEIHDNIVAFWVPATVPAAGEPLRMDYRLRWTDAERVKPPAGAVVSTRTGAGKLKRSRLFVVDFDGPALDKLPADAAVTATVSVGTGAELKDQRVYRNTVDGTWRLAFEVQAADPSAIEQVLPDKRPYVDVRAFLRVNADVVSETWSYAFKP
jgi:glucans biosynthesis protein